jgi:hypothetical protein
MRLLAAGVVELTIADKLEAVVHLSCNKFYRLRNKNRQ